MKWIYQERSSKKGFTLIELLVVISIISLISSVVLTSLSTARLKARQVRRLSDMRQIFNALQLYYEANNQTYPNENSGNGSWEESHEDGGNAFLTPLVPNYLPVVMKDPVNTSAYRYAYYLYTPAEIAAVGCSQTKGNMFVLGIRDVNENGSISAYPGSPGWRCPGRNWQTEFDWVIGGYEK